MKLNWIYQNESFEKEILCLQRDNPVPKNSTILRLDPTITDKLLRVGERLKSTELSLKCHSHIIIDKNHPLAAYKIPSWNQLTLWEGAHFIKHKKKSIG